VKLGAAKVLARANLDDMRASSAFGVKPDNNLSILTGSGGNAKLEPFRAKALDLSYEKYFGNKGYVSAAAFYKKLDTYILRAPRAFDFKDQITPATQLPTTGPFKGSTVGLLTKPINGDGGNLHGFELAVNMPFSMMTPTSTVSACTPTTRTPERHRAAEGLVRDPERQPGQHPAAGPVEEGQQPAPVLREGRLPDRMGGAQAFRLPGPDQRLPGQCAAHLRQGRDHRRPAGVVRSPDGHVEGRVGVRPGEQLEQHALPGVQWHGFDRHFVQERVRPHLPVRR
jgi:hypothetical protein